MNRKTIRIIIADDHAYVRSSLRCLLELEAELRVIAEAGNGLEAVALVEKHQPDFVLMDVLMPVMNGIEATRIITSRFPETKVVLLTMDDDKAYSEAALQAGACRFLTKNCGRESLINAITECSPGPSRVVENTPH
jgi:DNA-binding NarL/FixJ family response regulator